MNLSRLRRRTVTPAMRAEFARMIAEAPTQEQVIAGLQRVTESLIRLGDASVIAARSRRREFERTDRALINSVNYWARELGLNV